MKRRIQNIGAVLGIIVCVLLFSGGEHTASAAASPAIIGNEKTMYLDGKNNISIEGEHIVSVAYTSSESSIATISEKGVVVPKKKGKTTIKVTVVYKKTAAGKNYTSNLSYKLTVLGKAAEYFTYDFRKPGGKTYEVKGLTQAGKECKNLYIPSYIDGRKVTSIAWRVLDGNAALQSLHLSDTIQRWFRGTNESCPNLKKVYFGKAIRGFGYGVNPTLPGCPSLREIILDSRNEKFCVEKNVLFTKDKKELLCYPAKREGSSYIIPDEVITIGNNAFSDCKNLKQITFTDNLKTLEYHCFANSGLTAAIMSDEIKYLGTGIFSGCDLLEEVNLSKKSMTIPREMFKNCISLKELTIPASIGWMDESAFKGCKNLTKFEVSLANKNYCSKDGIVFSKDEDILKFYPMGKKDSRYTVPEGIKRIGDRAFYCTAALKEIVLPEGLESIGYSAFYGCTGLTGLVLPDSVHTVEEKAFQSCEQISKLTLSDRLTAIGEDVFSDCTGLTEVMIPKEVSNVGIHAFKGCSNLKRFLVDEENTTFTEVDGILFNKTMQVLYSYPQGKAQESYTVPNSVKRLKVGAFMQAEWLKKVSIPDTVTYVESQCFQECESLETVRLPKKLTEISSSLFRECESLTDVKIPSSVTTISPDAFRGCNKLTGIKIPNSVTDIGTRAFYSCARLKTVTIGTGVKMIGTKAFAQNRKMKSLVVKTTKIKENMIGVFVFSHTGAENGKKLTVEVPASKKADYTVYFKGAGLSKNAVIK